MVAYPTPPVDLDQSGRIPQTGKTYLGPTVGWKYTDEPTNIEYVISGGTDTIVPGYKMGLLCPDWLVVNNWFISTDRASGSIVVDIYKVTGNAYLAGVVPSAINSISGTDKPRLTNQAAAFSNALTGWATEIDQNDFIGFNVNSCSGLLQVTVVLQCVRVIGQS